MFIEAVYMLWKDYAIWSMGIGTYEYVNHMVKSILYDVDIFLL